jgi:beta-glucosidase
VADPLCFSARLTATYAAEADGVHRLGLASAGSARLLLDGNIVATIDSTDAAGATLYGWGSAETVVDVDLAADQEVEIVVEFDRDTDSPLGGMLVGLTPPDPVDLFERAVEAAANADTAVVVVGLDGFWETEGNDREFFALPGRQDELVRAVAARNPRTVVLVNAGSPVPLPWADEVAAIVLAGYPGQSFGRAVADVLFGDVSPSGKLATTWPVRLDDCAAHGPHPRRDGHVSYAEGLHLGHRHFDRAGLEPQFAFGHGLSYTTFEYGDPVIDAADEPDAVTISVAITNTGARHGAEVVQLYVSYPASAVDRPVRELRGFDRIELGPGESGTVTFALAASDVAYWDVDAGRWVDERAPVTVAIGASSRDIRAEVEVDLHAINIQNQNQDHGLTQGEPT